MDSLISFYHKNTGAVLIVALLFPLGAALIFGALKSLWNKRKSKNESAMVFDFLKSQNAYDKALTNDEIVSGTGIKRERVIAYCADHPDIKDAGKRQRSWRLRREDEPRDDE